MLNEEELNGLKEDLIKIIQERCSNSAFIDYCNEDERVGEIQDYISFITKKVRDCGFEVDSVDKIKEEYSPAGNFYFRTVFSIGINQYRRDDVDFIVLVSLDEFDLQFLNPKVLEITSHKNVEEEFNHFLNSENGSFIHFFKLLATKCCRDLLIEREFQLFEAEEERRKEKIEELEKAENNKEEKDWLPF